VHTNAFTHVAKKDDSPEDVDKILLIERYVGMGMLCLLGLVDWCVISDDLLN
jgi:hypothetical protein